MMVAGIAVEEEYADLIRQFEGAEFNGPTETGIAAGAELTKNPAECLAISARFEDTIISAFRVVSPIADRFANVKRAGIALAVMVKKYSWSDQDSHVVATMTVAATDQERSAAFDLFKSLSAEDYQLAANIATAGKVNWYQTNHHVGQRQFQGYMAKVIQISGVPTHDNEVYSAVWKMTHWVSTRGVLAALGVVGLTVPEGFVNYPKAAEDVILRVTSFPAGTAKLALVAAILEKAASSVFESILELPFDPVGIFENLESVRSAPILYHTGAFHIVGEACRKRPVVPEEALMFCAAFIHAVAPESTLAKGKALPKVEEVRSTSTYVSLRGVIDQIRMQGMADEEKVEKIKAATGAGAGIRAAIRAAMSAHSGN